MSWEAKAEAMHIFKYEAIDESYFMIAEMWKSTPRNNIHKTAKSKSTSNKLKRRNLFYFENTLYCNGNHIFIVDHGYPRLFHGHVFIFHSHGQECNHSATKTWLTIVIIMVIKNFPKVNHPSLKKEYNGRPL